MYRDFLSCAAPGCTQPSPPLMAGKNAQSLGCLLPSEGGLWTCTACSKRPRTLLAWSEPTAENYNSQKAPYCPSSQTPFPRSLRGESRPHRKPFVTHGRPLRILLVWGGRPLARCCGGAVALVLGVWPTLNLLLPLLARR